MKIKELKEEMGDAIRRMNSLAEKYANGAEWAQDDISAFEKDDLLQRSNKDKIASLERVDAAKALVATENNNIQRSNEGYRPQVTVSQDEYNFAFRAWSLARAGHHKLINDKMRRSVERVGANFHDNEWICRTGQTVGTNSQGGYAVQGSLYAGLVEAQKAYGGMRSVSQVIKTEQGNPLHWATLDDTSNVATIIGENASAPSSVPLTFGTKVIGAFHYTSQIFPVSLELAQDSMVDIGALVGKALGIRFARKHNSDFTVGTGSTLPYGFLSTAVSGVTAAGTTAVTMAELISLFHSVDPSYRNNAVWMMSDSTLAALKKLTTTTGKPLLIDGYIAADGLDRIMGKVVVVNNDMPAMTAGLTPIAFGDFSYYVIRDVADVNIRVLDQIGWQSGSLYYVGYSRNDGVHTLGAATKVITMAAS